MGDDVHSFLTNRWRTQDLRRGVLERVIISEIFILGLICATYFPAPLGPNRMTLAR